MSKNESFMIYAIFYKLTSLGTFDESITSLKSVDPHFFDVFSMNEAIYFWSGMYFFR